MANLELNDMALDLIRHLPYPKRPDSSYYIPSIMHKTDISDYHGEDIQKYIAEGEIWHVAGVEEEVENLPSCVTIATRNESAGYGVVLDTDDGYVYWYDPSGEHDEPEPELNRFLAERFNKDDPLQNWRFMGCNVYEPAEFFGLCKQRFRELRWIGLEPTEVQSLRMNDNWYDVEDTEHAELMKFMKIAGWPGEGDGREFDRARFQELLGACSTFRELWSPAGLEAHREEQAKAKREEEVLWHSKEKAKVAPREEGQVLPII